MTGVGPRDCGRCPPAGIGIKAGGRHGHPHGFHRTVCRNGEETVSAAVWGRVALWDGDH